MESSPEYYVYLYLRDYDSQHGLTGWPYYVGKGRGSRAYGKHRVQIPASRRNIVFVATGLTNEQAQVLEIMLIQQYGRINTGTGCLANLTDGGEGNSGWKCGASTRSKISEARKGKCYLSTEHYQQHSRRMTGTGNPFHGKHHSAATRAKWSKTRKGKKHGPIASESRARMAHAAMESYRNGRVVWNKGKAGVQDYSSRLRDAKGHFVSSNPRD